jgi:hypothetical protein
MTAASTTQRDVRAWRSLSGQGIGFTMIEVVASLPAG